MLCLSLRTGEYLTIGDNIILQLDRMSGDKCKFVIKAPKEVSILRGSVLERTESRPDCIVVKPQWRRKDIILDRSRAQALTAMRKLLCQMDGTDENVKRLRKQLNHIFPPQRDDEGSAKQLDQVSSGAANRLK